MFGQKFQMLHRADDEDIHVQLHVNKNAFHYVQLGIIHQVLRAKKQQMDCLVSLML